MGRMLLARVLVVLGALLAVLALLAGYIRFQALDTDTVENTAGELIADPEIRNQIAASLVDELFANVDVEAALREELPADQKGLAAPIASALQLGAEPTAQRLLARPRVQELWVRSISASHRQLIQLLEGDEGALQAQGGNLVLDLRPLVVQLGDRVAIVGRISERLPPDTGLITIMEADNLETAQDVTQLMKVLGLWLWIVPIALWGIALWLARGRRRAILRLIAFSSIIAGVLVLVIRRVAGSTVVEELAPTGAESVEKAAGDAWDILTSQLRDGGFTLLGIGVILLAAVWIAGPSRWATAARRWLAPYIARPELAFGAAAVLLLLLVWWGPVIQTQRWQLILAAAIALALGVEVLRRQTAREFPELVSVTEEDEGVVKKQ
jgi:hypothetical protein